MHLNYTLKSVNVKYGINYSLLSYIYMYIYIYIYIFPMALRPNAGHGLLFLEVSRSHTTTHHIR